MSLIFFLSSTCVSQVSPGGLRHQEFIVAFKTHKKSALRYAEITVIALKLDL